jgi:hypothetical protein
MSENREDLNSELQRLQSDAEADVEISQEETEQIRDRIEAYLASKQETPQRRRLRDELLELEARLVEAHPRFAEAMRHIVAIIDNAGL